MSAETFEIHVRGAMTPDEVADFAYLTAVTIPAKTILTGVVPDQSALYGIIVRLQSLGLGLVEVRRLGLPPPPEAGKP